MKKIVFGRRPKVYLPEISAYINYVNKNVDDWTGYDSLEMDNYDPMDFDVVWRFMGFDVAGKGRNIVHEYNSLSTGMFAHFKNDVKRFCNKKPMARVFLSRAVKSHFPFTDNVPHIMRDMGIDKEFFTSNNAPANPEYDFVYAGSIKDRGQVVLNILEHFKTNLQGVKLLVIGGVSNEVRDAYGQSSSNITFTGRVPYTDVPELARRARLGLNLMPDVYPLNAQTATKVIEYCALNLGVVSSNYKWARRFERKRHARFFFLENDFSNLTMKNIEKFDFMTPNVDDLEWDTLIRSSKVFDILDDI